MLNYTALMIARIMCAASDVNFFSV